MTCLTKRAWILFIFKTRKFISLEEYRRRMNLMLDLSEQSPTTVELSNGTMVYAEKSKYWSR